MGSRTWPPGHPDQALFLDKAVVELQLPFFSTCRGSALGTPENSGILWACGEALAEGLADLDYIFSLSPGVEK